MAKRNCINEESVREDGLDPLYACPDCGHGNFGEETECGKCGRLLFDQLSEEEEE